MVGAVTFDFHNTLAQCEAWFELEVRRLVSAFLRWQAAEGGDEPDAETVAEADAAYRRLREAIVVDGRELPAEACVARVLTELGLPVDGPAIERGVEALMRGTLAEARPVPGAIETVRALRREGVTLGVISSAVYHPFLEWTLDGFGVRGEFAAVVTSASAGFYKSRPELYRNALGEMGAAPERSVHVGDSYRFDVGGAGNAGLATVWLRPDPARSPDGGPSPDLTLASLDESAPLILGLLRSRAG